MTVRGGLPGEYTTMARTDSGAVSRRPHHISSIAHLFLEESRPKGAGVSVPEIFRCAVAAPGGAAISAFAAAGLALGSPGSATLAEGDRIRWSAGTYFNCEAGELRVRVGADEGHRNTWKVSPAPEDPEVAAQTGEIHWNHLGCVGGVEMGHLESLAAGRSAGLLPETRSGGLVWCLQEDEAGRFGPNYFLGRLAEVVKPGRIEILLFPNAWSSVGQPGWLDEIRSVTSGRYESEILAHVTELAKKSCDGIPVGIHQVAGPDNLAANFSRAGKPDSLWRRVAMAMIAGLAEC